MHYPDCDGDGDILKGDTGVQGSARERDEKEKEKRRNTVLGNIKMEAKAKKTPYCSIRWKRKQVFILSGMI